MPRAGSGEGCIGSRAWLLAAWGHGGNEIDCDKKNTNTDDLNKNELMSCLRIWGNFVGVKRF